MQDWGRLKVQLMLESSCWFSYQKEIVADSSGYSLYVLLTEVVVCSSNSNCCSCSSMNIIS
ncbi:hypothetical protein Syun_004570 [Stephania yunnanensis]|uniref:Uncharacterized protein n=1 Tax=Stephania yunnanensis TaxID=152371 RepID=A0AAP0L4P7_9MAGN